MGDWQKIETAPKDGTPVLVFNTMDRECGYCTDPGQIGVASWGKIAMPGERYYWMSTVCCDGVSYFKPTHWMPLPEVPRET